MTTVVRGDRREHGGADKSRVVVLGGTGEMGTALSQVLRGRGHDVVAASRATGVDATTGAGLDGALSGAETVVDCLNHLTVSRRTAVSFFGGAAEQVSTAAGRAGVRHVVCLSIVNAADQRVGPVALVPGMRLQPVHPAAAADFLADAVDAGPGSIRLPLPVAAPA